MNLIDVIKDQFSNDLTDRIGSLIGGSESQTKSALGAAVPALLSAISGMVSADGKGAEKFASAINNFDAGAPAKMANLLGSDPDKAAQQGGSLLSSLLGEGPLSALIGAVSKFVSLDSGIVKKLLGYISPFVLGALAKQFQGRPATAQGVKNYFAEQNENIADAMPAGFSLANVPGLSDVKATTRKVTTSAYKTAGAVEDKGTSILKTLLPIAALALLAFLGWQFLSNRGEVPVGRDMAGPVTHTVNKPVVDISETVPDVSRVSSDLTSFFKNATESLSGVTDAASAEAALPQLKDLNTQIDLLADAQAKLPASARSSITTIATDNLGKLRDLIEKVLDIAGVREKLGPILNGMLAKLKSFEGNS